MTSIKYLVRLLVDVQFGIGAAFDLPMVIWSSLFGHQNLREVNVHFLQF